MYYSVSLFGVPAVLEHERTGRTRLLLVQGFFFNVLDMQKEAAALKNPYMQVSSTELKGTFRVKCLRITVSMNNI